MVTCQSSELGWEVTVELPADFLSLGRESVIFYGSQCLSVQRESHPTKRSPRFTPSRWHRPLYGHPGRPSKPRVVRVHEQLPPTQTPTTMAWGPLVGGTNAFTLEEPGPRVAGIKRHLGFAVCSFYPQPRGSTAFHIAEISNVQ